MRGDAACQVRGGRKLRQSLRQNWNSRRKKLRMSRLVRLPDSFEGKTVKIQLSQDRTGWGDAAGTWYSLCGAACRIQRPKIPKRQQDEAEAAAGGLSFSGGEADRTASGPE